MIHEQIKFKTIEDSKKYDFCPITQKPCNKHCMWIIRTDEIDDDGIDNYHQCAIVYLTGILLELEGAYEEEDEQ